MSTDRPTAQPTGSASKTQSIIAKADAYGAHNYHPLPVVLCRGKGVWVWDVEGKRYLDMLSAYSAVSHGHCHPEIVSALKKQAERLTLTSRAFHHDLLGDLYERLVQISGLPRVLPMNSGAEAVETALKLARKWGHETKGVKTGEGEIIACNDNFHGRTISVISFSSEPSYREGFEPLTPGFRLVDYGDIGALDQAIGRNTIAFIVEPLQGEAGVIVPPEGYLAEAARLCRERNVLLIVDEVQTGLGRTGKIFCCQHDGVEPDLLVVGKALGGGVYPVSAVLAREEVMHLLKPGQHGSTFGGNPLAAAAGIAAIDILLRERLTERAADMGAYLMDRVREISSPHIAEVRGRGLLIGVVLKREAGGARPYCEALMKEGLLAKETHEDVIRLAPPLVIERSELDWAVGCLQRVLS